MKEIRAEIASSFKIDLQLDGHKYILDKPTEYGGDNLGASPVGYLLSSLVGCKLMVCKAYMAKYHPLCYKIEAEAALDVKESIKEAELGGTIDFTFYGVPAADVNLEQLQLALKRHCTVHKLLSAAGAEAISQTFRFIA